MLLLVSCRGCDCDEVGVVVLTGLWSSVLGCCFFTVLLIVVKTRKNTVTDSVLQTKLFTSTQKTYKQ